ncbi:hypothetical protein [Endozoicomonas acroporae]|uniref:hypothetical protein n=1 Tax=Endozoicomonas acroporae TaxID=1701104 RepID=UPI003D7A92E0
MTSPISASTYPKMAWQEQQKPETTNDAKANTGATENTGTAAKFNNLSTKEVVPATKIPQPDFYPFPSQSEKDCYMKSRCVQSVTSSSGPPPIEFRNMIKIERQNNSLNYKDMLKYSLAFDGLLQEEKYSECENTVKEFTGVYIFNNIDTNHSRRFPHQYIQPSDPHSIYAGQFDDGRFFLLALNPILCEGHFVYDSHNKNVRYFGETVFTQYGGENTHSLYCGESYKEALEMFEQACRGTIIADNIRNLLGFESE